MHVWGCVWWGFFHHLHENEKASALFPLRKYTHTHPDTDWFQCICQGVCACVLFHTIVDMLISTLPFTKPPYSSTWGKHMYQWPALCVCVCVCVNAVESRRSMYAWPLCLTPCLFSVFAAHFPLNTAIQQCVLGMWLFHHKWFSVCYHYSMKSNVW